MIAIIMLLEIAPFYQIPTTQRLETIIARLRQSLSNADRPLSVSRTQSLSDNTNIWSKLDVFGRINTAYVSGVTDKYM